MIVNAKKQVAGKTEAIQEEKQHSENTCNFQPVLKNGYDIFR